MCASCDIATHVPSAGREASGSFVGQRIATQNLPKHRVFCPTEPIKIKCYDWLNSPRWSHST